MRYYLDTEFIEAFHKPLFGKRRHFIDLISIDIISEDGRHYHAVSREYDYRDADDWVRENVITPLYVKKAHGDMRMFMDVHNFQKHIGKSNLQIAAEIYEFINPKLGFSVSGYNPKELVPGNGLYDHFIKHNVYEVDGLYVAHPEFYGYYSDYDWVVFCSLFGTMMQLPPGFPMFCHDLKQTMDEVSLLCFPLNNPSRVNFTNNDMERSLGLLKKDPLFPVQQNEHLSEFDAKWNKELHEFLMKKQKAI